MIVPGAAASRAEFRARLEVARAAVAEFRNQDGAGLADWSSLARQLHCALRDVIECVDQAARPVTTAQRLATRAGQLRLPPCSACGGTGLSLDGPPNGELQRLDGG